MIARPTHAYVSPPRRGRWSRRDIARIAEMRELGASWACIGERFAASAQQVEWAWRGYWRRSLDRYFRDLERSAT